MKGKFHLKKMATEYKSPVVYALKSEAKENFVLNKVLGKEIRFAYEGTIRCIVCNKQTKKSFAQGFCYNCFRKSPEASECIIFPERCRGHLGEGRDPDWEKKNHVQEHCVYLAASDVLKVGVTRASQIPTRWIDQGAHKALVIARTPNRHLAGQIEVALKEHYTDRTNWRKMLAHVVLENPDWEAQRSLVQECLPEELCRYLVSENRIWEFTYPVRKFPSKVKSLSFDKEPRIAGKLAGIKGQYLIFDDGRVLNIRKHTGYEVEISVSGHT